MGQGKTSCSLPENHWQLPVQHLFKNNCMRRGQSQHWCLPQLFLPPTPVVLWVRGFWSASLREPSVSSVLGLQAHPAFHVDAGALDMVSTFLTANSHLSCFNWYWLWPKDLCSQLSLGWRGLFRRDRITWVSAVIAPLQTPAGAAHCNRPWGWSFLYTSINRKGSFVGEELLMDSAKQSLYKPFNLATEIKNYFAIINVQQKTGKI